MSNCANIEKFHMTLEDVQDFKRDLLAIVYNETFAKLSLYQKGNYLQSARRTKSRNILKNFVATKNKESLPPPEILDEIQLNRELDALKNIFQLAYDRHNWSEENPHKEFLNAVEQQRKNYYELDDLMKELNEHKAAEANLKEFVEKEKREGNEKLSQKKQHLKDLRNQLKNLKKIHRLEIRLIEKWGKNRLTQANLWAEKSENRLKGNLLDLKCRIADMQRSSFEILAFLNNEISELKTKISHWQHKFEVEIGAITAKYLSLTQSIADVVRKYEQHRATMEEYKIFIADYLRQKAEQQRLYEEQQNRIMSAIRIQAWWRGIMVRRGLGPYRKKSKKKKKSKGKKQ